MSRGGVLVLGGGAKGSIGEEIVEQLVGDYSVYVADIRLDYPIPNHYHFHSVDLTHASNFRRVAEGAVSWMGHIGAPLVGVVYAVGANRLGSVGELSEESYDLMMNLNLKGVWRITRELLSQGIHPASDSRTADTLKVIALGSNTAYVAKTRSFGYAASKAGLVHMMKCMHRELAPDGWSFTSLDFGIVMDTAMTQRTLQELEEQRGWDPEMAYDMLLRNVPGGKPVTRSEIAATVKFLLQPEVQSYGGCSIRFDSGQQQG